jgi:hypothetical protein
MRFSSRPGGNPEVKQGWPPTHGLQSSVTVVATLTESGARLRDRCSFMRVIASKNSSRSKRKNSRPRQMKLIKACAEGKTYLQAAIAAGYPEKNARQSGFQAMQQIRAR